jgi:hypothetical protein
MSIYLDKERFTLTDVTRNEELYRIACDYARNFRGEYQFLRNARDTIEATGKLPDYVAKGVLNCMLYDPTVTFPPEVLESKLKTVPLRPVTVLRPLSFDVAARFNPEMDWITSTSKIAQVSHRFDRKRSHARYLRKPHIVTYTLFTRCGTRWQSFQPGWNSCNSRILSREALLRPCGRCELLMEGDL